MYIRLAYLQTGVLCFYGNVKFEAGLWAGVELDEPVGRHSGSVSGVQYFKCRPKHGEWWGGSVWDVRWVGGGWGVGGVGWEWAEVGVCWVGGGWKCVGREVGGRWVGVGGCMGWEKAEVGVCGVQVGVCEVGVGYCAKCLHVECE